MNKKCMVFFIFIGIVVIGVSVCEKMKSVESEKVSYTELSAEAETEIPEYYFENDYFHKKLRTIANNSEVSKGVSFAYITDLHIPCNLLNSKYLLKKIVDDTCIENVFFGGDSVGSYPLDATMDAETLMHECGAIVKEYSDILNDRFFQVRGNHDYCAAENNTLQDGKRLSNDMIYEFSMKQTEAFRIGGGQQQFYYYVDDPEQKVRYIILDHYEGEPEKDSFWNVEEMLQEQYDWLCNTALAAEGYSFIVFTHAPTDSNMMHSPKCLEPVHGILSAINNKTVYSYKDENISVNVDYTDTDCEVICNIAGHTHKDFSCFSEGVLTITTTCDMV